MLQGCQVIYYFYNCRHHDGDTILFCTILQIIVDFLNFKFYAMLCKLCKLEYKSRQSYPNKNIL